MTTDSGPVAQIAVMFAQPQHLPSSTSVRSGGLHGFVYVQQAESERGIPCYAPDALALALRANLPIYATAEALAYAERLSPFPSALDAGGDVRQWLEQARPEDFLFGVV